MPTLPTMQLQHWQFGWRFILVAASANSGHQPQAEMRNKLLLFDSMSPDSFFVFRLVVVCPNRRYLSLLRRSRLRCTDSQRSTARLICIGRPALQSITSLLYPPSSGPNKYKSCSQRLQLSMTDSIVLFAHNILSLYLNHLNLPDFILNNREDPQVYGDPNMSGWI